MFKIIRNFKIPTVILILIYLSEKSMTFRLMQSQSIDKTTPQSPPSFKTAADLLGGFGISLSGASRSDSSSIATNDGTKKISGTGTSDSSTILSGLNFSGTTKNSGLTATDFSGSGKVNSAVSGGNSAALGQGLASSMTDTKSANVADIISGMLSSGTATKSSSNLTLGKSTVADNASSTTLGTLRGDAVMAAATDSKGTQLLDQKTAANLGTGSAAGLLAVNSGSGEMQVGLDNSRAVAMENSAAGTSTTGSGKVIINGNGSGSTSTNSSSSIVISDLGGSGEGVSTISNNPSNSSKDNVKVGQIPDMKSSDKVVGVVPNLEKK